MKPRVIIDLFNEIGKPGFHPKGGSPWPYPPVGGYSGTRAMPPAEMPEGVNVYLAADIIALSRPLLRDPDWVVKAKEGKEKEIKRCTYCNDCMDKLAQDEPGLYIYPERITFPMVSHLGVEPALKSLMCRRLWRLLRLHPR